MDSLKLVLDSNEYVLHFSKNSDALLMLLNLDAKIYLNALIFREAIRNIRLSEVKELVLLLKNPKFAVNSEKIPQDIIDKYKNLGLKKGDIVIAAFCEFVKANYLITENRHFLKEIKFSMHHVRSMVDFLAEFN